METAKKEWPADVPVPTVRPKLKIVGRDGNAFFILGAAHRAAEKSWTKQQWNAFRELATAGDYDHLLRAHMAYFDVR